MVLEGRVHDAGVVDEEDEGGRLHPGLETVVDPERLAPPAGGEAVKGQDVAHQSVQGVGRDAPPAVLEHVDGGLGDLADAPPISSRDAEGASDLDVRLIASSQKDLKQMVQDGEFREELFYLLNTIPLEIPPLRERPDDTLALILHFLEKKNKAHKLNKRFTQQALDMLLWGVVTAGKDSSWLLLYFPTSLRNIAS